MAPENASVSHDLRFSRQRTALSISYICFLPEITGQERLMYMGMCFFDVAVPGGWYKWYESQVWFGVWLGGMIRGMARAPLNSCFVALGTAFGPLSCYKPAWGACDWPELDSCHSASDSCCARWKAQSHCLRRTSWLKRPAYSQTQASVA